MQRDHGLDILEIEVRDQPTHVAGSMAVGRQTDHEDAFARLLIDAAQLDARALAEVNEQFLPRLTRYAAARGASDPEAVANQVLYDGIRSIDRMRRLDESVFRAYLFTSVVNRVINEQRVNRVQTVTLDPDWHGGDTALDPANLIPFDDWFQEALEELLPDQRAVIVERFAKGATIKETAQRLGRSPDSVRHLQARGLARIRRYILAAGILALLVAALFALSRIGLGQSISVEPIDQQDLPLISDQEPPTTRVEGPDETGDAIVGAASTTAIEAWEECALEDDICQVPGPTQVRYGAGSDYAFRTIGDEVDCSNAVFGDPALNVPKTCAYLTDASAVVALQSLAGGKCLDVSGTKLADGDELMLWECATQFGQHRWSLELVSDSGFLIRNALSDRCVDVGDTRFDVGDPVLQNTCDATATHQLWSFDQLEDERQNGTYLLRSVASGLCLDVEDDGTSDGVGLVQRSCTDVGPEHRWALFNITA